MTKYVSVTKIPLLIIVKGVIIDDWNIINNDMLVEILLYNNMTFKFQKLPCINNVSYLGYDEYGESILVGSIGVCHLRKF